ncbi:MAG: hypothetical protein P4L81_03880 [Candidatus Pacebacteria bacterium]|nr:hypothetical protein [Candidatus Paceibacterota bacterium]
MSSFSLKPRDVVVETLTDKIQVHTGWLEQRGYSYQSFEGTVTAAEGPSFTPGDFVQVVQNGSICSVETIEKLPSGKVKLKRQFRK